MGKAYLLTNHAMTTRLLRDLVIKQWKCLLHGKMLRRYINDWLLRLDGSGSLHGALHNQRTGLVCSLQLLQPQSGNPPPLSLLISQLYLSRLFENPDF